MEIPRSLADAIIEHALEEDPNECCGLLAGNDAGLQKHYRMTNVEKSPYRYSMDGKELLMTYREIEDADMEIRVIYHSHTHSPAYPSDTDVRLATWPDAYYLLVSLADKDESGALVRKEPPELRIFRILDGKITEEPLTIG